MIQQTSLEAYNALIPVLSDKQVEVYDVIQVNPGMSNHDIARFLGWEINCVTGRVKELRDLGVVTYSGDRLDPVTDRTVMCWEVY